jgi:hypothetical protein
MHKLIGKVFSMRHIYRVLGASALLFLLICASCKPDSSTFEPASSIWLNPSPTKDTAKVFDVTYTPETVTFTADEVKHSLKKITDDGATYTFDASSSTVKKLHTGSIMLLSNYALARVTSATTEPGVVTVKTEPAAITDAISDGNIEASQNIDFASLQSAYVTAPEGFIPVVPIVRAAMFESPFAPAPTKFSLKVDPFVYTIGFTPAPGQMNIEMTISDSTADLTFKVKGYIKNYQSLMKMVISKRKMTNLDFNNSGLDCNFELSWSAASTVAGPMNKISKWTDFLKEHPALKAFAFKIPFAVGPIPMALNISAGIIFTPAFTSKNTLLKGSLNVHYSGSAGFKATTGTVQPVGTITQATQKDAEMQLISLGPIGFRVGVEFPRLELGLGGMTLAAFSPAAFVSPVTAYGIVYGGPAAMLPCETHIMDVSVNVGLTAKSSVFSLTGADTKAELSQQIYKKSITGAKPGMMACPK